MKVEAWKSKLRGRLIVTQDQQRRLMLNLMRRVEHAEARARASHAREQKYLKRMQNATDELLRLRIQMQEGK